MSVIYNAIQGKSLKLNTAEDVKKYCDDIKSLNLTEIRLSGNTLGVQACEALAQSLASKNLKIVKFNDIFTGRLKDEIPLALEAFVKVLVKMKNLVEVDLSDNAFGPAGAAPLTKLIIENRNIEILRLNNNGLGIEGTRLVSIALKEAHDLNIKNKVLDKLHTIVMGRNRMESPGCAYLASSLSLYSKSLKHLQLPQNSIRPEGIANLVDSISVCKNLIFLDLQDNTFTKLGSAALAKALDNWQALQEINLGDCLLGATGGISVIKGLTNSNPKLQRIALFFNEINDTGAKLIPDMLKNKLVLKSVELNGNCFEADGPSVQAIKKELIGMGKGGCLDELDEMEEEDDEVEFDGDDAEETLEQLTLRLEGVKVEGVKVDCTDELSNAFGKVDI